MEIFNDPMVQYLVMFSSSTGMAMFILGAALQRAAYSIDMMTPEIE